MIGDEVVAFSTSKHVSLVDGSFVPPTQITASIRSSRQVYADWVVVSELA